MPLDADSNEVAEFMLAVKNGQEQIVESFLTRLRERYGSRTIKMRQYLNIIGETTEGIEWTVLMYAAEKGHDRIVKKLLHELEHRDIRYGAIIPGWTESLTYYVSPLLLAVQNGHIEVVRVLLPMLTLSDLNLKYAG